MNGCAGLDWVRDAVLVAAPNRLRDHSCDHLLRLCGCQMGAPMHCSMAGESKMLAHKHCAGPSHVVESPETYLPAPRAKDRPLYPVWLVGVRHIWTCPCGCHLIPVVEQLGLFEMAGI